MKEIIKIFFKYIEVVLNLLSILQIILIIKKINIIINLKYRIKKFVKDLKSVIIWLYLANQSVSNKPSKLII